MHKKPAINIGFEPPGSNLPNWSRFSRHVDYEHYLPVVASGAIMLARSISELNDMIQFTLDNPHHKKKMQQDFLIICLMEKLKRVQHLELQIHYIS